MGLRTEHKGPPPAIPEKRLWSAVILQAIKDSAYSGREEGERLAQRRARLWASLKSRDFKMVCDLAEVSHDAASTAILERAPQIIKRMYGAAGLVSERRRKRQGGRHD